MDDLRVGWLVEVFKGFRAGDGMTTAKMRKQPELVQLLTGEGTAEEAKAELETLVLGMGDGRDARAVRNSLVISNGADGIEARGGPESRRRWATDINRPEAQRLIDRSFSSHIVYEKAGFKELAELILDRAAKRDNPRQDLDAFQTAGSHSLDEHDQTDAPVADEPDDHQPLPHKKTRSAAFLNKHFVLPPKEELEFLKKSSIVVVTVVVLIVAVAVGVKVGMISGTPNASAPQPQATISTSPDTKIDNSGGWGPERKTFTMEKPAPYPVFNSITNSRPHGDERNFMQCRDKEDENRGYRNQVIANDGHTYLCYFFFNNDIAADLEARTIDGKTYLNVAAALQNARARVLMPSQPTYNPAVTGRLSADNSIAVWHSCNFVASQPVKFTYIRGSATMHTKGVAKGGVPLKETYKDGAIVTGLMVNSGAPLGDKQDGYLYQNGGYILFELKVTLEGN